MNPRARTRAELISRHGSCVRIQPGAARVVLDARRSSGIRMRISPQARRQQAVIEIERLGQEFAEWFEDVRTEQYETQLTAIQSEVLGAASLIARQLAEIDVDAEPGEAYGRCTSIEKQITWLWRVWYYFRDKFNQRKDERFAATLEAADEVVWSCYRPFFKAALTERVPEPAPLPYIETEYSPLALRRDQASVLGARSKELDLVSDAFESLPVPILKLPIATVSNPWMLVLIGHETGHFIQPLIAPDDAFVKSFREAIAGAVGAADGERWGRWSVEIFADWYSIVTMGTWAIWTIAQFELADQVVLATRRPAYPSPLVRLELMAAFADGYGLDGARALADLEISEPTSGVSQELAVDRGLVETVAATVLGLPECQALAERVGLQPGDFGKAGLVEQWSDFLLEEGGSPVTKKPSSARRAAAGAAHAWDDLVFMPDALPDAERMETLRTRSREAIKEAAMSGVRSSLAQDRFTAAGGAAAVGPGAPDAAGKRLLSLIAAAASEDDEGIEGV